MAWRRGWRRGGEGEGEVESESVQEGALINGEAARETATFY
jgi:hypothetical protein